MNWPANVSGPISHKVIGLQQGTNYTFRVCGRDQGAPITACGQERRFETQAPDRASGTGSGTLTGGGPVTATVNASSGPSGENPTGSVNLQALVNGALLTFDGTVRCLSAGAAAANLIATGPVRSNGALVGTQTLYARVVPSPTPGQGTMDYRFSIEPPSPSCALHLFSDDVVKGDFTVTDNQPPSPPT